VYELVKAAFHLIRLGDLCDAVGLGEIAEGDFGERGPARQGVTGARVDE